MTHPKRMTIAAVAAAVLTGSSALAAEVPVDPALEIAAPARPVKPRENSNPPLKPCRWNPQPN